MSIHDVDKSGERRDSPTPNSSDGSGEIRMAHQTVSSHYQPPGVPVTARLKQVGKSIIANDGNTNKAMLGYNPALNQWGFFVAKDGVDVLTNTDLTKLIFNSSQDTLKVIMSNIVTVTTSGFGQFQTLVAHGQSTIPSVLGFTAYPSAPTGSFAQLPFTVFVVPVSSATTSLQTLAYASVAADATNLIFTIVQTNSGITDGVWKFRYYALEETSSTS